MKQKSATSLAIICATIAGALITWTVFTFRNHQHHNHHQASTQTDFHQWLHDHIELTPAQEVALKPYENRYNKKQFQLKKSLRSAASDLANAIRHQPRDSPKITQALQKINRLQGELQQLSIEHFFEMKNQLDPEQAEKLLLWTHDSILQKNAHQ